MGEHHYCGFNSRRDFYGLFFIPELTSIPMLYIFITVLLVILSFIVWVGFNSFKYKGYALRQHDIIFKSGIFFRSTTIISFNRVQHIEINQGPLDRYFNIAGLTLYTAGGSSSDLTIPGLSMEDANRIKEWIMKKRLPMKKNDFDLTIPNRESPVAIFLYFLKRYITLSPGYGLHSL